MPLRVSWIINLTTEPTDRQSASPHSGSWSEGFWTNGVFDADGADINLIARKRSLLLPVQCDLVGWRIGTYTISGNKLLPGGTRTVKHIYPGNFSFGSVGVPQGSLQVSTTFQGNPNAARLKLKALPDDVVKFGEYQPSPGYKSDMTAYLNALRISPIGCGAVISDLLQPSFRVLSIAAGIIVLDAAGAAAVGEYLILRRVKDENDDPVTGTFRVTAVNANAYTVAGLPAGTVVANSGFARKDVRKFAAYAALEPGRLVAGKIGSPSEKYRGRRSKQRA